MKESYRPPKQVDEEKGLLPEMLRALEAETVDPQYAEALSSSLPSEDAMDFSVLKKKKMTPPLVAMRLLLEALSEEAKEAVLPLYFRVLEVELNLIHYARVRICRGLLVCAGEEVSHAKGYTMPFLKVATLRQLITQLIAAEFPSSLPGKVPTAMNPLSERLDLLAVEMELRKNEFAALSSLLAMLFSLKYPDRPVSFSPRSGSIKGVSISSLFPQSQRKLN